MSNSVETASFSNPKEKRPFDHGELAIVTAGDLTIGRATFHPGWQWSKHIKPIAGTQWCMMTHKLVAIQGQMEVSIPDSGEQFTIKSGDVAAIAPGHDAKVVGDQDFVAFDLSDEALSYAKPQ